MTKRRKPRGPGKYNRMGLTVKQLFGIVPNEEIAEDWFEKIMWGADHEKRHCGHCGAMDTVRSKSGRPMKYRVGPAKNILTSERARCSWVRIFRWTRGFMPFILWLRISKVLAVIVFGVS